MAAPSAPQSSAEKRNFEDTSPFPVGFQIVHVGNGKVALTMPTPQLQMVTPKSVSIPINSQLSLANFVGTSALAAVPPDATTLSAAASLSAIGVADHSVQQQQAINSSKTSSIVATTGSALVTQSQVIPAPPSVKKLASLSIQTLDTPSVLTTSNKLLQHSPTNATLVNHTELVEEMNGTSRSELTPPKSSIGNTPGGARLTLRTTTPLSAAQDVLHRENEYPLQDPTLIQESVNSLPIFLQTSNQITSSPQAILTNMNSGGAAGGPLVQSVKAVTPNNSHDMQDGIKKREMRLYKNREAARECRRKKKEYLKCLENRVQLLENQNKSLIEELRLLKEHYQAKEQQHQLYAISSSASRTTPGGGGAANVVVSGASGGTNSGSTGNSEQMIDEGGGGASKSLSPSNAVKNNNKVLLSTTDLYTSNSSQDNSASE